jgi:hypothetical protein
MKMAEAMRTDRGEKKIAGVQSLMEGIILQSIEDLWIAGEEDDCINFFRGEGFGICADIAGMNLHDQVRLLNFADKIIGH